MTIGMATDVKQLKAELTAGGIEIYRTQKAEIHVAERVRLHIMDSGVRVRIVAAPSGEQLRIGFTARAQRSDFPDVEAATLFEKVRHAVGPAAASRGFVEAGAGTVEVKDPMDAAKILDVWHEVTYEKDAPDTAGALDAIRWALALERCVQR
jgi:hypothetical protein